MVNLKTKIDKHLNDDEKRRKSIVAKEKAKLSQSQLIKQALTESSLRNTPGKKIVFSNEDDAENGDQNDSKRNGKPTLFEGSDSENENFEFKEKTQFSGKKGFELLNLQSTYGNDERFKIDERFLEDEGEDVEKEENEGTNGDALGEKAKQLKLLEDVLGSSVVSSEKEKNKKRTYEMIRYDASNKDHEIYEKKEQSQVEGFKTPKRRKESKRTERSERMDLPKPKVSKEKFYEVSSEIKSRFKEKQEGGQFSLLQTYGVNGFGKDEEALEKDDEEEEEDNNLDDKVNKKGDSDFEKALQEEEMTEGKSSTEKTVTAKGIWKETFFINEDDERLKEGLEFINKKESSEAIEAAENFDKTRKRLKEILRLHLKKQMHKKDPFKNKIGGMNKKQLASSKFKNPKMLFNKRKPPRRNFERTT